MALKEFLGFKIETCITAETASEAYKVLDSQQVDCIILDMYLPDADGKDVLKTLKSNPKHKDIPVIIYSGKNLGSDEEQEILEYASEIVHKNVKSYKVLLQSITDQMSTKPVEN
jgi:CheY-like chemotaxis protein